MNKYKVYYEQTELHFLVVEANSAEEAELLAEEHYVDYEPEYIDGTLMTELKSEYTEIIKDTHESK